MKILHVLNTYFAIPYFLGDQLLYFHDKGYQEHIICSPSDELALYANIKKFIYAEEYITRSISPITDLKSIWRVYKYIKQHKIDIVTGHTPKGALVAMCAGFLARTPKRFYFRHGLVYETSTGIARFTLKSIDKLCAHLSTKTVNVSPSVLNISLKDKLGTKRKQILLGKGTCNGVDTERFSKQNINKEILSLLKTKYKLEDIYTIGYVGRLVKDKGIIELVNGFIKFNQLYPESKLLLVGMFEERDALPDEIVGLIKNHSNIIYTGYIDNAKVDEYYGLFDVFILPSYREGFPTVVLEASSMELAVITTKVTGCIDSILPNQTGIYIDNNADSIYKAFVKLYSDPILSKKLGESGRKHILENYQQEKVWQYIEELYIQQ